MDTSSRKVYSSGSPARRGLKEALEHVSKFWFPINMNHFIEVKRKLQEGAYKQQRDTLVKDLKADLALFTYFLKQADRFDPSNSAFVHHPIEIVRNAEDDLVRKILDVPEKEISPHFLSDMEKHQAQRIKFAIISTTTSQALAQSWRLDNDMAYSCAVLRQVGLNLVAWNFPRIYSRALGMLPTANRDFNEVLTEALGFDPIILGCKAIFTNNKISPFMRSALGMNSDARESGVESKELALAERLTDACTLAEKFAAINEPEYFPQAAQHGKEIIAKVSQHLGRNASSFINDMVQDSFRCYTGFNSKVLDLEVAPHRHLDSINSQHGNDLLSKNPYVSRCSPQIQQSIAKAYSMIFRGTVSTDALEIMLADVIPKLGFTQGCVYLLQPARAILQPALRIGASPLSRYRAVNCTIGNTSHAISQAYYSSTPIMEEGALMHGELVSHISGVLGNNEKGGVLYLELSEGLRDSRNNEKILYFRLVQHTLCDCLGLGR